MCVFRNEKRLKTPTIDLVEYWQQQFIFLRHVHFTKSMIKKSHSYEPFPRIHFIWPIQTVFETSRAARSLLVSKQTSIFSTHTKFQPVLPAPVPLNLFIPLATIFLIDKTAVVVAIARDVPCFVSPHHMLIPGTGLTTMRTTMRTTTTTMNGSPQKLSRIKIC